MFDISLYEVWVTRDKRRMFIADMQTSHIINCINLIYRCWPWRQRYLDRLKFELAIRNRRLTEVKQITMEQRRLK